MTSAGMNRRSWTSKGETLRAQAAWNGVLDSDVIVKILGMRWDPIKGERSFAERNILILVIVTKMTILKYSSQIYDPLGLLQELWNDKYDWDTPLPDPIFDTWNQLARSLNRVTEVKFIRQLFPSANSDSESTRSLHIFVDASVKSYGAAAYICE